MRFPEFTGEWKLSTIGDECDILCGYAFAGKDILEKSGDVLLMRGINIAEGHLRHSEDLDRFYSGPKEKLAKYVVRTGDVVIGMDGSKVGHNAATVTPKEDGAYLVQRVCRLRSNKTNMRLLIQYINNPKYYKYVDAVKTASAIPHISQTDIQKFSVYLPTSKQEQDKIGNLLSFIDERIATQSKIIEDLELLKSAISRVMITRYESHTYYLGDIADIYQPQTIEASAFDMNASYNVYGANGIIGKYHEYNHDNPQICIACRGNSCGVVNYTLPKSWITGNAMVINTDNYNVNKRFLFHYLSNINFSSIISGSGQPQIVRQPLLKLKIHLPSIDVQLYHAQNIDCLCYMIENEKKLLNLFVRQKQYLLRQMFI